MTTVYEKNCLNCKYSSFRKCLKGPNGEILDPREVDQEEGIDEYNRCIGHIPYVPNNIHQ